MLTIEIKQQDLWNEATNEFVVVPGVVLELEHSLLSLSKWESIHKVPFLSPHTELTDERLLDYLRCMVVTPGVDPAIIVFASADEIERIQEYIASAESATTFRELPDAKSNREQITSELVYFWMNSYSVPMEAESWHLNRLFSLLRIHSVKNAAQNKKPRSAAEIAAERRLENERRRKMWESEG